MKIASWIFTAIENGEVVKINDRGRAENLRNGKMAVIAPHLRNGKITYLFTAYKTCKKIRTTNKRSPYWYK